MNRNSGFWSLKIGSFHKWAYDLEHRQDILDNLICLEEIAKPSFVGSMQISLNEKLAHIWQNVPKILHEASKWHLNSCWFWFNYPVTHNELIRIVFSQKNRSHLFPKWRIWGRYWKTPMLLFSFKWRLP